MSLSVKPKVIEVATDETSITYLFDATARLADEGVGVTVVSAVLSITDLQTGRPAHGASIASVESPNVSVVFNGSTLLVGHRYRVVVTYTSSEGNTEAMPVEVVVPF